MGNILGLITTLLAGGKFLGLTLVQWEAIVGVAKAEEPAIEALIKNVTPVVERAWPKLTAALAKVAADSSNPSAIPGYSGDGSVTTIQKS